MAREWESMLSDPIEGERLRRAVNDIELQLWRELGEQRRRERASACDYCGRTGLMYGMTMCNQCANKEEGNI